MSISIRWNPGATGAAIVENDVHHLPVEEHKPESARLNNPPGTLPA